MAIYSRKNTGIRDPGSNKLLTVSLFADVQADSYDNEYPEDERPLWLEYNEKGDDRPVFREVYLEKMELSGAAAAVQLFGCTEQLDHLLRRSAWFRAAFERMQKELKDRLVAAAQQKIFEIMMSEDSPSSALSAAKYIHSSMTPTGDTRGRPSKAEVKGKLKDLAKAAYEDDADFDRITKHLN